jgi:hypothetical protein
MPSESFNLTDTVSLNARILYNFVAGRAVLPDIRNVSTRLAVGGGDIKITDLNINALNIKINAEAEYVLSAKNVNTFRQGRRY